MKLSISINFLLLLTGYAIYPQEAIPQVNSEIEFQNIPDSNFTHDIDHCYFFMDSAQVYFLKAPLQFTLSISYDNNPVQKASNTDNPLPSIVQQKYNTETGEFRSMILPLPIPGAKEKISNPLPSRKYQLPTREEFNILSLLWKKGDLAGPELYSDCDTSLHISFTGLEKILKKMCKKSWLERKQVSPSQYFTFQAQGNELPFKIEMSQKNRRNRVYLYHSNIDSEIMRNFIIASVWQAALDSTVL